MNTRRITVGFAVFIMLSGACLIFKSDSSAQIRFRKCPPFFLRTETGQIINPVTGENAEKPFSMRMTCSYNGCHDYDKITKGYHFQQGWDRIKDDYSKEKPWVLSDGMLGKM